MGSPGGAEERSGRVRTIVVGVPQQGLRCLPTNLSRKIPATGWIEHSRRLPLLSMASDVANGGCTEGAFCSVVAGGQAEPLT